MPFAYLDRDLLDLNIRHIAAAAGSKKIRIASKSIRSVEALRYIFRADDRFQGIMCYSAEEACFLAGKGFDDLLLGYPTWEASGIGRLVDRIGEGRRIVFMTDCLEHVERIEQIARARGVRVPLCLDIDMSSDYPGLRFGVWRSPLSEWDSVRPVAERIVRSEWVRLEGIMGYEAQIAGVGDNAPGAAIKNGLVRLLKKRSIREVARRRQEIAERLRSLGAEPKLVNAGGTGSLASSREEEAVTELTAGSGFYSPGLFDHYRDFRYAPAAGFAVEVVRKPRADIVTCMGGGYVASGAADNAKLPTPFLPEGLELLSLEGAGEVQTPLRRRGNPETELALGDPVFFRHAKAGELCERFDSLFVVSDGTVIDRFATYRGMGENFL
ncbi:amino acid deaminase/aldolase [Cohnella cellulosilytica]|uniref:Amino acid deaminase/aldolase n=1 Tax=Cohnella cellulosilytica TaxID=986710 RepID=A0ABW2FB49_9BACL